MIEIDNEKTVLVIFTFLILKLICVLASKPPREKEIRKYFYVFPINKTNPLMLLCWPLDDREFDKKDVGYITWEGFVFAVISVCIFIFGIFCLITLPVTDNTYLILFPFLGVYYVIAEKFVNIYVWFCRRREKRKK